MTQKDTAGINGHILGFHIPNSLGARALGCESQTDYFLSFPEFGFREQAQSLGYSEDKAHEFQIWKEDMMT